MSRRNTRQGKARRRAQRDRGQVTERERNRPGTPDQGPRAVGDQAAPRPDGSGPRNSDEHGSGLRSAAGGGLIAVDPGEAGLQAALAEEDLVEADLGDAGEVADDLAGDAGGPEVPDGPGYPEDSQRGQPSADAKAVVPGGAAARVVKLSPDGAGEDEGISVFGDDDDLPAAQAAVAGATADPVKDYLKQIGKVPLLNAEQEVELAERIEAGLFAEEKLAERENLSTDARIDLEWI